MADSGNRPMDRDAQTRQNGSMKTRPAETTGERSAPIVAPTHPQPAAQPDLRTQPLHEEIARAARELWVLYGRPSGRDEEIWLEAERQLLGVDPTVARLPGGGVSAPDLRETGAVDAEADERRKVVAS